MTEQVSVWNRAVIHQPVEVYRCADSDDVRNALQKARAADLPVSVLGGGHDWAGRAIRSGGLVIDLRGMRKVVVKDGVATVEGGATAADVIAASALAGLVPATGTASTVGMAGLTLGGGYAPLLGTAGLALDNLLAAEVVLADGRVVTADADHEPELFWALRGGGGNFGVVTRMRVRLHPFAKVLAGSVVFPWAQAADVLAAYAGLVADAPDALTSQPLLMSAPDDGPRLFVNLTWSGDSHDGAHWFHRIENLGRPESAVFNAVPYAMLLQWVDDAFAPDGRHYALRTRTLPTLTSGAVESLITSTEARTSPLSAIAMHHLHGTAARVPATATAFAERREHFMVEIIASWRADDNGPHREWADTASGLLQQHALPGGYPNLLAPDAHDQIADAYGPNAQRLLAAKARFDPDGIFTAIPLPPGP
ncbi:FAD-binding oxidoreductase [Streptomyces sp. WMMC500]|uniref:FAD-binding oxidoreductase n=1 Tax=Streptomyces sp. WMMC500 TaxID=3015154 RepID=UPI00248BB667|nr:FAD-binding oxidoreductase [Streptomyces sp. WMMC500]WBB62033.1 FAD-binding oxidoreductase [Streptomyces sp. WMMC500]